MRRAKVLVVGVVLGLGSLVPLAVPGPPASAAGAVAVGTTAAFADAFFDPTVSEITLTADVQVLDYTYRTLLAPPLTIEGRGHTIELGPKGTLSSFGYSNLTIHDATVTAPGTTSPEVAGGRGLRWRRGVLTLDRVTVTDAVGTPVSNDGGTLNVTDSTFTANRATPITAYSLATVSVVRSTFSGNRSGDATTGAGDGYGGAIYVDGTSAVTVVDSTFDGNHADVSGGAIFGLGGEAPYGSAVTIVGSSFTGNDAPGGGAIVGAKVALTNSTVTGNTATDGAGGVAASRLTVRYSTIVDNAGPVGANLLTVDEPSAPPGAARADWYASVVGGPRGGGANCAPGPGSAPAATTSSHAVEGGGDSCGFSDPTDRVDVVDLGFLPVVARATSRGVRIPAPASILVDAIAPAACRPTGSDPAAVLVDQRGVLRPQGGGCDVGAVERQASDPVGPPTTTTTTAPPPSTPSPPRTGPTSPAAAAPATAVPGAPRYAG